MVQITKPKKAPKKSQPIASELTSSHTNKLGIAVTIANQPAVLPAARTRISTVQTPIKVNY